MWECRRVPFAITQRNFEGKLPIMCVMWTALEMSNQILPWCHNLFCFNFQLNIGNLWTWKLTLNKLLNKESIQVDFRLRPVGWNGCDGMVEINSGEVQQLIHYTHPLHQLSAVSHTMHAAPTKDITTKDCVFILKEKINIHKQISAIKVSEKLGQYK